jgi:hypothetical protein
MKIKLTQEAASEYVRRCYKGANPRCGMLHNPQWAEMLRKVQGQWLDVETEYLFRDQFNTGPIAGVSEQGMRIDAASVAEIADDVRPGLYFDRYTHKNHKEIPEECKTGERRAYLLRFVAAPARINPAHLWLVNVFPEGADMCEPRQARRFFKDEGQDPAPVIS